MSPLRQSRRQERSLYLTFSLTTEPFKTRNLYSDRTSIILDKLYASISSSTTARIAKQKENYSNSNLTSYWSYIEYSRYPTWSKGGCGFPRQKFDNVHVAFLSIESLACSFNCASKGSKAPCPRTRSRHLGESPATFPNAHTACTSKRRREGGKYMLHFT